MSKGKQQNKDLQKIEVSGDSPRFGSAPKAGKYGQSQHQFIKQSQQNPTHNTHNIISIQQLSKHKQAVSAWISLKGVVYDVTNYIKHHPGGDTLLEGCGKQSQKLFNEHHSWVNAKNILHNCVIGHLQNN